MKKNHLRVYLSFLYVVGFASTTAAISVDRIVLVERKPDVYVRTVQTALNMKTGQTLVVWAWRTGFGAPESIRGHLLGPDGKPQGNSFPIVPGGLNIGGPGVVYDPDTEQFVLVYSIRDEIYAIRLKPTGRKKGKPVLISHPYKPENAISNIWPVILYDSLNKANVVIWLRFPWNAAPNPADPQGIYGSVLNADLSIRRKPVFIENIESGIGILFGPDIYDAAIHPSGRILLAQVLYTPVTFQTEFSVAQVDATLQKPNATIKKLNNVPANSGCQYGVCFEIKLMQLHAEKMAVLYSLQDGVRKRKFDSKGDLRNKVARFFAEPLRSFPLKINGSAFSSSGTSEQLAVLGFIPSEIDDAQFWLQLGNAKGKAVGEPILIDSGVDCVHGGIISALPAASAAGHMFAVLYREGERDNPPLANLGTGLVLLRVNTAP